MPRLIPVHWKKLKCVFEKVGFKVERVEGSHLILTKPGVSRPVVIPKYENIDIDIIKSNMRTAGMSREQYFELLKKC
ncbi:MAG: hypothetical protein A2042_07905 [Candidatus Schekmanbacteria bacterium GWA2_38_11]|uniref:Addiction module toxin, HicA family n=1 Tax=Candidatus Schekmanbacteria bacterium GWA2_38_11 TaxID=1817876 RepID=A0A1F7RC43_9BACT|nr:MAG: hypothetical protein A2042_07905 [Candidatus Schekmanbacteria bacterium GWA2_38_11]